MRHTLIHTRHTHIHIQQFTHTYREYKLSCMDHTSKGTIHPSAQSMIGSFSAAHDLLMMTFFHPMCDCHQSNNGGCSCRHLHTNQYTGCSLKFLLSLLFGIFLIHTERERERERERGRERAKNCCTTVHMVDTPHASRRLPLSGHSIDKF